MAKVEFVKHEIKGPEDVAPAIERLRSAAEELASRDAYTTEAVERIAADLKAVKDTADEVVMLRERVAKAEEIAKTTQEIMRAGVGDDEKASAELRALPMTRKWTDADVKEAGVRMSDAQYSIMQMRSDEIRNAIGDGPGYRAARTFRHLSDMLYVTHSYMVQRALGDGPEALNRYLIDQGGMKSLKLWPAYERAAKFMRTFDTATSGAASEWVPTMFTNQFFEDLTQPIGAADLFTWVDLPHNPYGWPLVSHGNTRSVKIVGEGTATGTGGYSNVDGALADIPNSKQLVLSVKKVGRFASISRELDQDSLLSFVPIMAQDIALEHGYARSISVINGQPIAASLGTFDTGRSLTAGSDVEDIGSACTPASWGVRRGCHASATPVDFGGALTTDSLAATIGAGKAASFGGRGAFIGGYSIAARALILKDGSGANVYLTKEKAADVATAFRGQIAMLMGRPFVMDAMYPEDLNASGIYDGTTTTKTSLMLVETDRFIGARRQGMQIDTSRDYLFNRDEVAFRSTERYTFTAKFIPTTAVNFKVGVAGVNIPSYS